MYFDIIQLFQWITTADKINESQLILFYSKSVIGFFFLFQPLHFITSKILTDPLY